MKFKRLSVGILANVMCFCVFSITAFAYVDENAAKEEAVAEKKLLKRSLRSRKTQG
ncbi:MAG: hypothetical protein Q4A59_04205 [Erysipelotrichaceae bacterium]|nr:hypothetical protein [Erysipelotrichaceae bacterium]